MTVAELLHKGQQGGETNLVILAGNAFLKFRKADGTPAFPDHRASYRHLDSQELVAIAIATFTGFEKTR